MDKELIAAGEGLETKVYVAGIISKVAKVALDFGNANYNISDDGTTDNDMIVFRGLYLDGEKFTSEDQIKVGDKVVFSKYSGTEVKLSDKDDDKVTIVRQSDILAIIED